MIKKSLLIFIIFIFFSGNSNQLYRFEEGVIYKYYGIKRKITIPEEINGEKVIKIGKAAFQGKKIEEIIFPKTLIYIDKFAFFKNQLSIVKFPEKLKKIGIGAFSNNKIKKIVFNKNLKTVSKDCFENNIIVMIVTKSKIDFK